MTTNAATYQVEIANKIRGGRSVGTIYVVTQRPIGRSGIVAKFETRELAQGWIDAQEAR